MKIDFSAVIFDLDGTLLYTLEEIANAGNAALSRMGYKTHPVDAYRYFVASGAKTLAKRILPEEHRADEEVAAFYLVLMEEYVRHENTASRPYDGVMEVLSKLPAAGKRLAILSNKPDELAKASVAKHFSSVDFVRVGTAVPDGPLKPAPEGAWEIADAMGVAPEKILFVGDSDIDMMTAKNANMIGIGAGWGFREDDELIAAGARAVIHSPLELLGFLEE